MHSLNFFIRPSLLVSSCTCAISNTDETVKLAHSSCSMSQFVSIIDTTHKFKTVKIRKSFIMTMGRDRVLASLIVKAQNEVCFKFGGIARGTRRLFASLMIEDSKSA